jgi:hypothetical protein
MAMVSTQLSLFKEFFQRQKTEAKRLLKDDKGQTIVHLLE